MQKQYRANDCLYSQNQKKFDSKVATPRETEEVAAALPDMAEPEEKETLQEQLRAMNPRDRLLHDLGQEIEIWRALGDQILVMGDFNEDVQGPVLTDFFAKFGMRNTSFKSAMALICRPPTKEGQYQSMACLPQQG
jgi:hypothetical protein